MVYTFIFEIENNVGNDMIGRYFTLTDAKISIELVNKVIEIFSDDNGFFVTDKYIAKRIGNKNILIFDGSKQFVKLTIEKELDEKRVKQSDKFEYISEASERIVKHNIERSNTGFRYMTIQYDEDFCKCLLENKTDKIIRYGKSFGDVFNSSYLGNRLQIRFSDCAVRIGNKVIES